MKSATGGTTRLRAVVLVFWLAVSVVAHHQLSAPAGRSAVGSHQAMSDRTTHASGSASAMTAGMSCPAGCAPDQMCTAAALAKAPNLAPQLLADVTGANAAGCGVPARIADDAAPKAPPGTDAILRI